MDKDINMEEFAKELQQSLDAAMEKPENNIAKIENEKPSVEQDTGEQSEELEEDKAEDADDEILEDEPEKEDNEELPDYKIIPNEWTEEQKNKFKAALDNPEMKEQAEILINRYKDLKKGFYDKSVELADVKKVSSQWNDIFDPYKAAFEQRGTTPVDYVKSLIDVDRQLASNPAAVIKRFIEGYKVTPEQLGFQQRESEDDYYENETITQLKKEIHDLKTMVTQKELRESQTQQKSVTDAVREFEHAIDENGNPKYPYFKEVKEEMAVLLQTGKAKDLEEAYKKSPTVREKMLEIKSKEQSENDLQQRRERIKKAKIAGRSVKTQGTTATSIKSAADLTSILTEEFRKKGFQ